MTGEYTGEITETVITVLIADDEPLMCRGLTRLIQNAGTAFSLVGCCHDGQQAFQVILHNKIDILITDIRMPVWDGLELARNIRIHKLHTKIVILSGFSQFEYAQQALSYGVTDYFLKPIDNEKFLASLIKLHEEILLERQINRNEQLAREESDKNRFLLVENTLFKLAEGIKVPAEQMESVFGILGIKRKGDKSAVAVYHFDNQTEEHSPRPIVEEIINGYNCGHSWVDRWGNICVLFIFMQDEYPYIVSISHEIADRLAAAGFRHIKSAISDLFTFSEETFLRPYADVCQRLENKALPGLLTEDHGKEIKKLDATSCNKTIKKVLDVIENIDSLNVSIENIASAIGFNSNYLSHLFKQETGQSFIEYITGIRIKKAEELLSTTNLKSYAIARMVGYSDSQYFSQVFKRYTGVSPGQFRKSSSE